MLLFTKVDETHLRGPRTARLARKLRLTNPAAMGYVVALKLWAFHFAQDGNLADYTPADIACGAEWEGDADQFLSALLEAGVLESPRAIHGWAEAEGQLFDEHRRDRERKKQERVRRKSGGSPADTPGHPAESVSPRVAPGLDTWEGEGGHLAGHP